ncbi:MAG: ATP-binding protein, partial [Leptospiraceae bacterium]|nr:ATP-binding protein [Leptospiraceae bacterium]
KLLDSDLLNMLITNNEVVKRSFNQINKINMMIDSQVEISKISAFEAASLFLEIRENFRDLAKLKNQDLFISTPSSDFKNKFIMVSKELLKEAYEELITNAFKFSEENSFITVLFYIQNQSFTTSVINKPFHVEKEKSFTLEQYNLVFEPFFRNYNFVDERYNTLDYGLGLTMVDIIAEKMNGRIHITKLKDHTFVSKSKQSEEKIEFILDLPIVS